ncbi:HAD family phosphatase [bacterium]|nr:HAD family phosphatase [bacterium]
MGINKFKGIILDFDGTLADSEPFYFRANRNAFREFGHEINEKEYYHHWSLLGEGSKGEVLRHNLKNVDLERLRNQSRRNYRNFVETENIPLFPGAAKLLLELPKHGYKVVIASNTLRELILPILNNAGFETIPVPVIGGDGLPSKPAPDIFLRACEFLNIAPKNCIVLEDTDKGVRAARAADIPFGVIFSVHYPEYCPDDAIRKFRDLHAFYKFLVER